MPIAPEAIEGFLAHQPKQLPDVKAMDEKTLIALIRQHTGQVPRFVTPPRPHQLQGLAAALVAERFLAFFDMRMGKTKMALDWAQQLAMCDLWDRGKGLIVVPAPILLDVWEAQTALHSVLRIKCVGPALADMMAALDSDADLIAVAWTSLQAMFTRKVRIKRSRDAEESRNKLVPDYDALAIFAEAISLVIVDEIHACKNHLSLRFMIGAAMTRHCRWRMGLTGTPWGRNPLDVWAQSFLIDAGDTLSRNYYFFEAAFGVKIINFKVGGRKEMIFDKKKMPLMQTKLGALSLSYRRADQGKGVHTGVVELKMRDDQRKAYEDTIDKLVSLPMDQRAEIKNTFIRLRQVASGYLPYVDEDGVNQVIQFETNVKMEWLRQFLIDIGPDVKCVFFHEFIATGEMICKELTDAGIKHSWLRGATVDKPAAVRDFQSSAVQHIVCNSQSGGMGIDLSAADYQNFIESPLSPTIRLQAERRAQGEARAGRPLFIDDTVAAPVDARVLALVKEGKDTLAELFKSPNTLRQFKLT